MIDKLQYWEINTYHTILNDIDFNYACESLDYSTITNQKLAEMIGASTRTIVRHIRKLEKLGFIEVSYKGKKRIIKAIDMSKGGK